MKSSTRDCRSNKQAKKHPEKEPGWFVDTVFDPPVWDVFSTVIATNQILVIDGGRIADLGTNEEFLERSEFYRRLYEEQFTVIPSLS